MSALHRQEEAGAKLATVPSRRTHALHLALVSSGMLLLAACGGNGDAPPPVVSACSSAISNATGKWLTVVNNSFAPPRGGREKLLQL